MSDPASGNSPRPRSYRGLGTSTKLLLAAVLAFALLVLPSPGGADPWVDLSPLRLRDVGDRVSEGWLSGPAAADSDPLLGQPATTPSSWATGDLGDRPTLWLGGGGPVGSGRLSLVALAGATRRGSVAAVRSAEDIDLDDDGRPELLQWHRRSNFSEDQRDERRLGARLGWRAEGWGLGAWVREDRSVRRPDSVRFQFPTTDVTVLLADDETRTFDLTRGERTARVRDELLPEQVSTRLTSGLDLGLDRDGYAIGAAAGWARQTMIDRVDGLRLEEAGGSERRVEALRDLRTTEDRLMAAARLHLRGDPGPQRWRAALGARIEGALDQRLSGTESWTEETSGAEGRVLEEWVREPTVLDHAALDWELRTGFGVTSVVERFRWGGGADLVYGRRTRSRTFRDDLTYRLDDPGQPGQRGDIFASADGSGRWRAERSEERLTVRLAAGGSYRWPGGIALLVGGSAGYRQTSLEASMNLTETEAIEGTEQVEPNVINELSIPYSNFEVVSAERRKQSGMFGEIDVGVDLGRDGLRLAMLTTWDPSGSADLWLEGAWRW